MKLPNEALREFQDAWFASFGEKLTSDRAETEALALLRLHATTTADLLENKHQD